MKKYKDEIVELVLETVSYDSQEPRFIDEYDKDHPFVKKAPLQGNDWKALMYDVSMVTVYDEHVTESYITGDCANIDIEIDDNINVSHVYFNEYGRPILSVFDIDTDDEYLFWID